MENKTVTTGHKFKVSELFFFSLQGESKYIGTPSIFLRLFGCNFSCAGFGMKRGELSQERFNVDPALHTEYDKLPLVTTGCDSYASWDVRFKKLSPMYRTDELVERIIDLLPNKRFNRDQHLVITGGEPLLGWQRGFPELINKLKTYGLTHVTFETNGTQPLTDEMFNYIRDNADIEFFFSVSSKLTVSGESWSDAIKPDVVKRYVDATGDTNLAFKFVVATEEDLDDVKRAVDEYRVVGIDVPVYLMPVGGVDSVYFFNNKTVAEIALVNGYRYSPRLQVDLWKNAWAS